MDGNLDLHAWDGETVEHFVNFLYLNTYGTRRPEPLSRAVDFSDDTASNTNNTESRVHTPDTVCSDRTIQPEASLDGTEPRPLTPLSALRGSPDGGDNDVIYCGSTHMEDERLYCVVCPQETHNYHDTLLAHAMVYALAQSLDIDTLCRMAYHRLLVILDNLNPIATGSHVALNIVELLRYVYANTHGTGDTMRKLVSQFVALNFTAVQGTRAMKELVGRDGQLAVDLMEKVCRRLVASEDELAKSREEIASLGYVAKESRVAQQTIVEYRVKIERVEKALYTMTVSRDKLQQSLSDTLRKLSLAQTASGGSKVVGLPRGKAQNYGGVPEATTGW